MTAAYNGRFCHGFHEPSLGRAVCSSTPRSLIRINFVHRQRTFRIDATEHPNEAAIGGRDDHAVHVMFTHPAQQPSEILTWADGRWPGSHCLFGTRAEIGRERIEIEPAMHNALGIDHDTAVPRTPGEALTDDSNSFGELACWSVAVGNEPGSRLIGLLSFSRQAIGQPVSEPAFVVEHEEKPETFEPPRGPWTKVSLRPPAIDDDRMGGVEFGGCSCFQVP